MRGKLLKKIGKFGDKLLDKVKDETMERIEHFEDKITNWIEIGKSCKKLSSETKEICERTHQQREDMITFASEIQSTLESGFHGGKQKPKPKPKKKAGQKGGEHEKDNDQDRSAPSKEGDDDDRGHHEHSGSGGSLGDILNVISDLTDGNKVKAAMELASGLQITASECVTKSVELTELMERGIDQLPPFLQKALGVGDDDNDDDDDDDDQQRGMSEEGGGGDEKDEEIRMLVKGLDQDITDVQTCIDEIQHLNLTNAFRIGLQAFVQLNDKAQRSRALFDVVQNYADDISTVTRSFTKEELFRADDGMNMIEVVKSVAKTLIRSIQLSDVMRLAAEGAGKILNIIIQLFHMTANVVSELWSALAFAKDCMVDCIQHVKRATEVCTNARSTTVNLMDKSIGVAQQLQSASKFDVKAIRSLTQDGEIQDAIDLAGNIDNEILDCVQQVLATVKKVREGFKKLPVMLTDGIDMEENGKVDNDPDTPNIDDDVNELETAHRSLEQADVVAATATGEDGFTRVSKFTEKCLNMLQTLIECNNQSDQTIESFLTVWDLESASNKIQEMCRMVHIGTMMENIANQIKRFIGAIIKYLKTAFDKFTNLPMPDGHIIKNAIKDSNIDGHRIQNAIEDGSDLIDKIGDKMKNRFNLFGGGK